MVVIACSEIALTDLLVLLGGGQGSRLSVWLEMKKRGSIKEDAAEKGAANLYTNFSQIHS